ncbi:hypothetical protein [Rouxiella badensis]|uniref:hypothetical protein n=1 Tax=Rouxiella badensis TaxID=1646377 RepID=UPI00197CD991|nr:hypothetical protein [Rouxiella badensis]
MAFPSPAQDYTEKQVSPNDVIKWSGNPALYLAEATNGSWRAGIKQGAGQDRCGLTSFDTGKISRLMPAYFF